MSDSLSPERRAELIELVQALYDERISPEESARLEEWVCRDEEARWVYVQYMNLYANLHWDKTQEPELEQTAPKSVTEAFPSPILGFLGDVFRAGTDFLSRPPVLTLLLTIGLPGILLVLLLVHIGSQPAPELPVAVEPLQRAAVPLAAAEVTRMHGCVWEETEAAVSAGTSLAGGDQLKLRAGLVELRFDDGAKLVLQGPTTFRIRDASGGFLSGGSLAAAVPAPVHGFTIQTPLATVVDLGTEFGVCVAVDGTAEAHVFAGRIRVGTRALKKDVAQSFQELHVGQAAKIHLVGAQRTVQTETIAWAPERFIRRLPPESNAGLSEPRILFAHRGDRDPATEGWRLVGNTREAPKPEGCETTPIDDRGTAAWSIDDRSQRYGAAYQIMDAQGMKPEVVAEAKAKGWVMRARVRAIGQQGVGDGLCYYSFWESKREWCLRPMIDRDGDQCLLLHGKSSLGSNATVKIPDSRDRYVDYEVRYDPRTNDADVYIDGKLVATGYYKARRSRNMLHFGTFKDRKCEARFARVEWGILGP